MSLVLSAAVWVGAFVYTQQKPDALTWMPVVASLAACGAAFSTWHRSPAGLLRWDGRSWHWSGFLTARGCSLSVLMDFQSVLLVSLKETGRQPVWLWLQAVPGDPLWLVLRRAIVSSRGSSAGEQEADPLEENGYVA